MSTYEHNSENAVSTGHRWIPVLRGEIYCSPGCGGRCKKVDYDKAVEQANLIASVLGHGWKPVVFENLGWHYEVIKGHCTVTPVRTGGVSACIRVEWTECDGRHVEFAGVIAEQDIDPRMAVQKVLAQLESRIARLKRALASSSLELLELHGLQSGDEETSAG